MASSRQIEAGRAYVRTDADLSPLEKKLKTIGAKFDAVGRRVGAIGTRFAAVGAGASAAGAAILAPIAAAVRKFTSVGDTLDKMSARTGVGVEALAELGFAAEQGGTDLAQVEKGFAKLSQTVFDAGRGLSTANDALAALGLNYRKLAGLSPEQQFQAVADALADVTDASKRGAIAQAIFGRSGRQLLPMLTTLREVRQEARDLGLVLSKTDTDNAAKLSDAFNRIKRTIGGAFLQVGAAVAEPLLKALDVITKITAQVNHWVAANRALVQQIAAVGLAVAAIGTIATAVGVAIIRVGATVASIGAIIGGTVATVSTVVAGIGAAFTAILSPVGLLTAAVVGLGGYIVYSALEATGSLTKLAEMFGSLGSTAKTAWGGIVAAVSTGDLETAGQIAFTALEIGWLTLTSTIQQVWAKVTDFIYNTWVNSVESIVQTGASIYFGVSKYFDLLATTLQGAFDTAFVYIGGAIDGIQTQIAKAIIKAQQFFGLFSQEETQQIQQSLDQDLERRAQGRQRGLDQRADSRQSGLDQRDVERRGTARDFGEIVAEDFERKRHKSSVDDTGLSAAQKRLEELKLKLSEQASGAQAKAAAAQAQASEKAKQAEAGQAAAASAIESTSAGSVGTFVSGVAGQILGGGVQDDIAGATRETADNTAKLTEQMRDMLADGVFA